MTPAGRRFCINVSAISTVLIGAFLLTNDSGAQPVNEENCSAYFKDDARFIDALGIDPGLTPKELSELSWESRVRTVCYGEQVRFDQKKGECLKNGRISIDSCLKRFSKENGPEQNSFACLCNSIGLETSLGACLEKLKNYKRRVPYDQFAKLGKITRENACPLARQIP